MRHLIRLLLTSALLCTNVDSAEKDSVPPEGESCKGTMEIAGKTYGLKYAVAYPVKVFNEDGYSVVFSDQVIPVEKLRVALGDGKGSDDKFFFFKPHVRVTFDKAGKVMFCNAWADNTSVSVSGSKLAGELAVKAGRITGKASLVADADSERKSSFDVPSFDLSTLVVPVAAAKPEPAKPAKDTPDADGPPPAAIHYMDLPLPDGATDVEYKKLVGQIRCKSPGAVKDVSGTMTKKLAEQGWETQGSDLVAKSATLRRKRGDATLTIFVKEIDTRNSGLTIMATGLAWDEKK